MWQIKTNLDNGQIDLYVLKTKTFNIPWKEYQEFICDTLSFIALLHFDYVHYRYNSAPKFR